MAIRVTCDDCGNSMNVADSLLGKKVRCKQCGSIVPVGDANRDDAAIEGEPIEDEKEARPEKSKKPGSPAKRPAAKRDRDDEDDEDRPRKRAAAASSSRRNRDDDDEEDDEEEDEPREKRRKKRKGPGSPSNLRLYILLGILAAIGIGGGVYFLFIKESEDGGPAAAANPESTNPPPSPPPPVTPGPTTPKPTGPIPTQPPKPPPADPRIDALVAQLDSTDDGQKLIALSTLKTIPLAREKQDAVASKLVGFLNDPDSSRKAHAMEGLAVWGRDQDAEAVATFVEQAIDQQTTGPEVLSGLKFLGRVNSDRALAVIVKALRNKATEQEAQNVLKSKGPAVAAKIFLPQFNDSDQATRTTARQALAGANVPVEQLIDQSVRDLGAQADQEKVLAALDYLATVRPTPPELRARVNNAIGPLLTSENDPLKAAAGRVAAHWVDRDSPQFLLQSLAAEKNPAERKKIIDKLAAMKTPQAIQTLVDLLMLTIVQNSAEAETVRPIVAGFGTDARDALRRHLFHTHAEARKEAQTLYEKAGGSRTELVQQAFEQLKSQDKKQVAEALQSIAFMAPDDKLRGELFKILQPLLADKELTEPVQMVQVGWFSQPSQLIQQVMQNPNARVRAVAYDALARLSIHPPTTLEAMLLCMQRPEDAPKAKEVIKSIGKNNAERLEKDLQGQALKSKSMQNRMEAVKLLSELGTKDSLATLEQIKKQYAKAPSMAVQALYEAMVTEAQNAIDSIKKRE